MELGGERTSIARMPRILYLVEICLAYILSFNIYKFSVLSYGLDLSTLESSVRYLYILGSTIISSEMTIRTMVKLSSAQKKSWQLANKTMILQIFLVLLNGYVFGNWARNPLIQSEVPFVFVCILCMLIMFLPHVRKYYTPPMVGTTEAKKWIPYILWDFTKDSRYHYVFGYDDDKKS